MRTAQAQLLRITAVASLFIRPQNKIIIMTRQTSTEHCCQLNQLNSSMLWPMHRHNMSMGQSRPQSERFINIFGIGQSTVKSSLVNACDLCWTASVLHQWLLTYVYVNANPKNLNLKHFIRYGVYFSALVN